MDTTDLFQLGNFTLNSGATSTWKLECDALSDGDWKTLAEMVKITVGDFSEVEGIPRGSIALANHLAPHARCECGLTCGSHTGKTDCNGFTPGPYPYLLIDDVLTTGGSMQRRKNEIQELPWRAELPMGSPRMVIKGVVVFARGECPWWITPLFQMPEPLWIKLTGK